MSNIILGGGTSGSGSVTLQAPNTNSNQTVNIPDRAGNLMMDGPAFTAHLMNSQSVSSGSYTKVNFDTEDFDTANCFSSNRFTPTVAGYYQLSTMVAWLSVSANVVFLTVYKNGSVHRHLVRAPKTAQYVWMTGSTLVYANGTTDYFEIYAYQDSGSTMTIDSGSEYTWFSGAMVRGA